MIEQKQTSPLQLFLPEPTSAASGPLLFTKLGIPVAAPVLLPRPRLIQKLDSQLAAGLTLICAPAGFGKTTLATEWARQQNYPVAWLTLDEQDNDPVLFWRYLLAALQLVEADLGAQAQIALGEPGGASPTTAATFLINDIARRTQQNKVFALILDDFHWIHNPAILYSLNYLLQHQPPGLRLILLSRADPPLSLARLRVEGRLLELRAMDLQLTPPESAAFLNDVMALNIDAAAVQLLERQVEGWPAGLQLAAQTLRRLGAGGPADLGQGIAGARQHIFAYLVEEVMRHQRQEVKEFLQQTAVLQQFCTPLCAAVTGSEQAAQILHEIAEDNLFVTAVDVRCEWYRYHPLFAEMLRADLDEGLQRDCLRRAAHWYAGQGFMVEAMQNALAAEDFELMAALLNQSYKSFLGQGLLVSLQHWLSSLPGAYKTPQLLLASAWCRIYECSESELQGILESIAPFLPDAGAPFEGEVLAVQAVYASLYGRLDKAIEWATESLELIDPQDFLSRAAAYQALGNAYRFQGQLDGAMAAYAQARRQFEALGNPFMSQLPLYRMAGIQIMQGRLHQALKTYQLAQERAQAAGSEPLLATGEVFGSLSDLYLEWNDLDRAAHYALQEIELAEAGHMLLGLVDGCLRLAAVRTAQGDSSGAGEALDRASVVALQLRSEPISARVAMQRARHDLAAGNLGTASAWAAAFAAQSGAGTCALTPIYAEAAGLLLARVRLQEGKLHDANDLLLEGLSQFEASGRGRLVVEANVLLARIGKARGEEAFAQKALIRALALAKEEGYIRVFVENGTDLAPMLHEVRHLFPDYVSQLLRALAAAGARSGGAAAPLDPLTVREQEILSLIAEGRSNQQIAEALFISVGTVKGHVNHIFSKLDVQNRTHALVRARELNLIDL